MAAATSRFHKPVASSSLIIQFFSMKSTETESKREQTAATDPDCQSVATSSQPDAALQDDKRLSDSESDSSASDSSINDATEARGSGARKRPRKVKSGRKSAKKRKSGIDPLWIKTYDWIMVAPDGKGRCLFLD